jgi:hypothetical protein
MTVVRAYVSSCFPLGTYRLVSMGTETKKKKKKKKKKEDTALQIFVIPTTGRMIYEVRSIIPMPHPTDFNTLV